MRARALTTSGARPRDCNEATTKWEAVPNAAKGSLNGLTGKRGFGTPMGSKGRYTLPYEIED